MLQELLDVPAEFKRLLPRTSNHIPIQFGLLNVYFEPSQVVEATAEAAQVLAGSSHSAPWMATKEFCLSRNRSRQIVISVPDDYDWVMRSNSHQLLSRKK